MTTVNLGTLADQLYAKQAEISAANQAVEALKKEANAIESSIFNALEAAGTDIASGKTAKVAVKLNKKPQALDWEAFYAFIVKRKAPHLLQRRIAEGALKELQESLGNKPIPGVGEVTLRSLSVTKV